MPSLYEGRFAPDSSPPPPRRPAISARRRVRRCRTTVVRTSLAAPLDT